MAQDTVKAFYQKIANDQALSDRYKTVLKGKAGADKDALAAATVAFARGEGFEFTAADLAALAEDMKKKPLSDEQLEAVAGGAVGWVVLGGGSYDSDHAQICFIVGYAT